VVDSCLEQAVHATERLRGMGVPAGLDRANHAVFLLFEAEDEAQADEIVAELLDHAWPDWRECIFHQSGP